MGAQLSIRRKCMIKATEQVRPVKTITMIIKMVEMLSNKYYMGSGSFRFKTRNSLAQFNHQSELLLKQVISIITCMHDISARRYIL